MSQRINRRTASSAAQLASAGAAGSLLPHTVAGTQTSASMSVTVLLNEPTGWIKPALYGQFAEHIGGVIYDGIWVGPEVEGPEHRRHSPGAGRACPPVGARRRSAGRAAASPTRTLARRHRPARKAAAPIRPLAKKSPSRTSSARTSSCKFCRLCGVEPYLAGQRRHRDARGISAVGRVLQCPGRRDDAGRRAGGQRRPRSVPRPLLGSRQRELGLRRQVHAGGLLHANIAGSPNGCPATACLST